MAKKPIEYVEIEIDDQPVTVRRDQVVLWSARELGFDVPHFCAHKWLAPYGACRMCLVRVELGGRMMPKLQTSCSLLPADGMKVWTKHPDVIQARKEQLEFHLLNHPLECPVCDKGGECMLQDQTMDHGLQNGRFIEQKRIRPDAVMNDYIRLNYKRCIHCKRCVNYASDIDGSYFLQFIDRGAETYIDTFADPAEAARFSGNVIDMCPVGALTAISYRFTMGRPWEQELKPSVGSLDSVGANIWINSRLGDVARIVPRGNAQIENGMLDDVTRFSWECIENERRITKAIVRDGGDEKAVSRHSGEEQVAKLLANALGEHGPDSVGILAGGNLNIEDYYALRLFAGQIGAPYYYLGDTPGGNENAGGILSILSKWHTDIEGILAADTVLTLGCDMFDEAPSLGLRLDIAARRGQLKLISARSHTSDFDRFAKLFQDYGYGNLSRLVRGLINALTGAGEVPDDVQALAAELKSVGEDCAVLIGQEVWRSEDPAGLLRAIEELRAAILKANPKAAAVYLNPIYPAANSVGALWINHLDQFGGKLAGGAALPAGSIGRVLEAAADGKIQALLVVDFDVLELYPDRDLVERALNAVAVVIYCGPFANSTSTAAKVHLPLGTWAHREGLVVNLEWRVQKRCRASIDSIAPSLLDVLNSICAEMEWGAVAADENALRAALAGSEPLFACGNLEEFPDDGVIFNPSAAPANKSGGGAELPAEITGTSEYPLVVAPKRFLYNDREEIRFSPVFDKVAKPFFAFMHPADMQAQGCADGESVTLASEVGAELTLPARSAAWVRRGSVVINDYNMNQPANRLASAAPVRVAVRKLVGAREE